MAITFKFVAGSASMSFSQGFSLRGHFDLPGGIQGGTVNIKPSSGPGEDEAFYKGAPKPTVNVNVNLARFEALSQMLRAADRVTISFTSATDPGSTDAQLRLNSFDISAERSYGG
jgi:hypothetical protein